MYQTHRRTIARAVGAAFLLVVFCSSLLLFVDLPVRAASRPGIGAISRSDSSSDVGCYQKLELTFPVTTSALNLQIPYDPVPPSYAANLYPDEDARHGVSVDGLFLPPGQTDWSQALVQPGFYYQGFSQTPDFGYAKTIENLVRIAPQDGWKVRFAPTALGAWRYKIRVTDAGGTTFGPVGAFECVASSSKGFVHVSSTDPRYFETDDGTPVVWNGTNVQGTSGQLAAITKRINQEADQGAVVLNRVWIASRNGVGVLGGFNNSTGGRMWGMSGGGNGSSYLYPDAHTGRYSLYLDGASSGSANAQVPVKCNTSYTVTAWIKTVGITGKKPICELAMQYGPDFNYGGTVTADTDLNTLPNPSGWSRATLTFRSGQPPSIPTGYAPGENFVAALTIRARGCTRGHLLVSDVTVTDPNGVDALLVGDLDSHVAYNQRQSYVLDQIVSLAESRGEYLRLTCLDNDENTFNLMAPDAAQGANAYTVNNFFGNSVDPNADTASRRFQRYYARYLMARWGYATAWAQAEYNNEGDPYNGNDYAAAQAFARAIHLCSAEGRKCCSTSFWTSGGGMPSYPAAFWEDKTKYPDIDYADMHNEPGPPINDFTPYFDDFSPNGGPWSRHPETGPIVNGLMRGSYRAAGKMAGAITRLPSNQRHATIRGKGTWTVKYQTRLSSDSGGPLSFKAGATSGPYIDGTVDQGMDVVLHTPLSAHGWQTFSGTFTLSDNARYTFAFYLDASMLTGGQAEFGDLELISPAGLIYRQYQFDAPILDHDTAGVPYYQGINYTSESGEPSILQPFSTGENDIKDHDGDYYQAGNPPNLDIADDMDGVFARQFAWAQMGPGAITALWWRPEGDYIGNHGFWKYTAAYERFMADIPLTNGRYRNVEARPSTKALRVIGQKDVVAGRAHFFVQNIGVRPDGSDAGDWYNLSRSPQRVVPATGTIAISGFQDGAYLVETWDTSQGQVIAKNIVTTSQGIVTVPISGLVADIAYKIYPATAPQLRVTLTVDKTVVKPGDTVTYTLTYQNIGSADATGVTLPWPIPPQTTYISASGGTYNAVKNEVDWNLGTIAAGQSGSVTLVVKVK